MQIPRPRPGQARLWIVATLGLVLLTAGAVWWGLAATVGKANWSDVAWDVKDDHTVQVRFAVSKPTDMTVRCRLEAQAEDHSLVGSKEVEVGPQAQQETWQEATITTIGRAVRGGVHDCREMPKS